MTSRRSFLRTSSLITLGLLTGAEALEAMARLTHKRKFHALGAVPTPWDVTFPSSRATYTIIGSYIYDGSGKTDFGTWVPMR